MPSTVPPSPGQEGASGPSEAQIRRLNHSFTLAEHPEPHQFIYLPTLIMLMLIFLLLLPLSVGCKHVSKPVDCSDIHKQEKSAFSGVYTIYPLGERSAVQVYCDMDSYGGGWTVFQRRMDGTVNFYRPWDQYKFGFGDPAGEYWLGLDSIYYLTNQRKYELVVDMENFDGKQVYAWYSSFYISGECDGYKIQVSGFMNGGAGDSLTYHNRQNFSTFDKDQDSSSSNCAKLNLGAFWYNNCHYTNPNGLYHWGADATVPNVGVDWVTWTGWNYSLKTISMKIQPVH
ncbi:microfibril-associated glycoprotein 4-like [Anabas testudineus]|uniref:Fibrinogen C-terminal domain-containing protein n=2 Tax=Anabas testudineus TaxID=64144 RepID=A0A7N6B2L4_ANATE|nr:microfibril-associated glycoprotein 4-like [Anabas testudineus]